MDYTIGIASYNRASRQLTLDYLERIGIDMERVIMSVQTEKDYEAYRERGTDRRVKKLILRPAASAAGNRNTILDELPSGSNVVLIDDDIKSISRLSGGTLTAVDSRGAFESMLADGYRRARESRTIGFGLYPVHNAYFMSYGFKKRNICDAGFFALVNTAQRFDTRFGTKEDYEFCCRAIRKYGAFVRLDN